MFFARRTYDTSLNAHSYSLLNLWIMNKLTSHFVSTHFVLVLLCGQNSETQRWTSLFCSALWCWSSALQVKRKLAQGLAYREDHNREGLSGSFLGRTFIQTLMPLTEDCISVIKGEMKNWEALLGESRETWLSCLRWSRKHYPLKSRGKIPKARQIS